jgi:hypothetical protein
MLIPSADVGVTPYLESCIKDAITPAIYTMAAQGGYLHPSGAPEYHEFGDGYTLEQHFFLENNILPYVVDGSTRQLRPLNDIASILATVIQVNATPCYDLSPFKKQGYTITVGPAIANVTVTIAKENVRVNVKKQIVVSKPGSETRIDEVSVELPLRLGMLYGIASDLTLDMSRNKVYNVATQCERFTSLDRKINIYKTPNLYYKDYAIRIIDAQPLSLGLAPLRFQFAIKNVEVTGQCVG